MIRILRITRRNTARAGCDAMPETELNPENEQDAAYLVGGECFSARPSRRRVQKAWKIEGHINSTYVEKSSRADLTE